MAADSTFAEALARLEHKVDVLMSMVLFLVRRMDPAALSGDAQFSEAQVGSPQHKCPLCSQFVSYDVDINDAVVVRKCGCKTGKIAIDMKAFAPPALPVKKEPDNGEQQQEDRRDPATRGRPGRR